MDLKNKRILKRDPTKPMTDYEIEEFEKAFEDGSILKKCEDKSGTTHPIIEPFVERLDIK